MRKFIDIVEGAHDMSAAKFTLEVGVLLRGDVRRILDRVTAKRPEITFEEEKDTLESTFTVRGPRAILQVLYRNLKAQADED